MYDIDYDVTKFAHAAPSLTRTEHGGLYCIANQHASGNGPRGATSMGKRDSCDWCIPAHSRDECEWRRTASHAQPERADRYHANVLQNSSHSSVCLHSLLDTCSTSREHCKWPWIPMLVDRWPAAAWRRIGLRGCGIPTMYIAAANSRKCRMRQLAELIKPAESLMRDQSPDAPDLGSRRVRCASQKNAPGKESGQQKLPQKGVSFSNSRPALARP